MQLYEDYDKATSGKKYGFNLIKDEMVHFGMSRENAENAYSVLGVATGTVGSDKVFKNLTEQGFVTGKVVDAKPLWTNTRNLLKGDKSKSVMKSLGGDLKTIGSNSKLAFSTTFSKEKFSMPHIASKVKGNTNSIIYKYNRSVVMNEYKKEGVKLATKEALKQNVINPKVNEVMDDVKMDKTSVGAKAIKHQARKFGKNSLGSITDRAIDSIGVEK